MFRWINSLLPFTKRDRPLDGGLTLGHVATYQGEPIQAIDEYTLEQIIKVRSIRARWKWCSFVSTDAVRLTRPDGVTFQEFLLAQATDKTIESEIIPGGWTHAHCEICRWTITDQTWGDDPKNPDSGGRGHESGYHDLDDTWLCESCYHAFIKPDIIPQITREEYERIKCDE